MIKIKIIATVKRRHNEDFINKMAYLNSLGLKDFRFNYSKVEGDTILEKQLLSDLILLKNKYPDINIIIDLPYPGQKIRLSTEEHTVSIYKGQKYNIGIDLKFSDKKIQINDYITYDSGIGAFKVIDTDNEKFTLVEAINDFTIQNNKSISIKNYSQKCRYSNTILSICKYFIPDAFAFSFVENVDDLEEAIKMKKTFEYKIISKIETITAMNSITDIANNSDAIMLGRGDFFLNSPIEKLYYYQKKIADICHEGNCDYHIATGFLNSYINNYLPTQSEVIDLSVASLLDPTSIVLNVDLIMSDKIKEVIDLINKVSNIYT